MSIEFLYPLAEPRASHRVEVDAPHVLHVQEYGNPKGIPVVFLHGGPGAGSKPAQIRSFDPDRYRIVLLDQRGCGQSTPSGMLEGNDTAALIRDLETIRERLGIDRWVVAGGSWGSLLTLSYAIAHPDRCLALRVHGIFLGRPQEVRFWFHDVAAIFPDAHRELAAHVDAGERDDLLAAYYRRLTGEDASARLAAAKALRGFSARTQTLVPNAAHINGLTADKPALEIARIFTHYCTNGFFQADNHILDNIDKIRGIPCEIIQGRYDTVTPMMSAQALREAWPEARFTLVDLANHVATREAPAMTEALRCAADRIADRLGDDSAASDAPGIDAYLALRAHHAATLSEDGTRLAWISDESGLDQLWTADAGDPEADRRMPAPQDEKVGAVAFRPGSHDILFSTDMGGDERHQLHLLDAGTGTVRALTQSPSTVHVWGCFSPDGARIAYACNPEIATDMEIRVMDLSSGKARRVLTGPGWRFPRRFTPDGTGLLIEDNRGGMYNASLHVLDIDSGDCREILGADGATQFKAAHWLEGGARLLLATDHGAQFTGIATLDIEGGALAWLAQPEGDVEQLALSADKSAMLYAVNHEGYSRLHMAPLDGGAAREIALPFPGRVTGMAMDPDGSSAILTLAGFRAPSTMWRVPLDGGAARCIAESSVALDPKDTVAPKTVAVPSFDGAEVPAFVFEPAGPAPAQGRPVIVFVHGGPESQYAAHWRADMQYFTRRGWLAVAPNVRGSTGYGRDWQSADDQDKRMDAVRDLKALHDWLAAREDVDAGRMVVTGQSYGGFMVLAAITEYPDDWRVAAEFYGIADFNTLMATTGPWRRKLRAVEYGDPDTAEGRELLARISPFAKISRVVTPLFIAHGGDDPRVTPVESELVYAALRGRGHDVELLRIDHEGHGFARAANRVAAYGAMCRFIESRARRAAGA